MNMQLGSRVKTLLEDIVSHTPDIGPAPRGDTAHLDPAPSSNGHGWLAVAAATIVVVGVGALIAVQRANSDPRDVSPVSTATEDSIVAVSPEPSTAPTSQPKSSLPPPTATPVARLAIGDSVMLGAAPGLAADGFVVDALQSRAFIDGLDTIEMLSAQGQLGDVVVVHLGGTGPINDTDMTKLMEDLIDVPQVLLVTVHVPGDWATDNNSLINQTAAAYPNVSVLDWAQLSKSCPGDCFYSDEVHLRPDGQAYYAELINTATQSN